MTFKVNDKGPTNSYAQLSRINRILSVISATTLLPFLAFPDLHTILELNELDVITVLGATLAGTVLISSVLNRLSLTFELSLVENVSFEELERKTLEKLEHFKREMTKKKQSDDRE